MTFHLLPELSGSCEMEGLEWEGVCLRMWMRGRQAGLGCAGSLLFGNKQAPCSPGLIRSQGQGRAL